QAAIATFSDFTRFGPLPLTLTFRHQLLHGYIGDSVQRGYCAWSGARERSWSQQKKESSGGCISSVYRFRCCGLQVRQITDLRSSNSKVRSGSAQPLSVYCFLK